MPTPTATAALIAECRARFTPKMRRSHVIELGRHLGLRESTMRDLIEGVSAPVPRETFAGQTRGYFDREKILHQLFPNPPP